MTVRSTLSCAPSTAAARRHANTFFIEVPDYINRRLRGPLVRVHPGLAEPFPTDELQDSLPLAGSTRDDAPNQRISGRGRRRGPWDPRRETRAQYGSSWNMESGPRRTAASEI